MLVKVCHCLYFLLANASNQVTVGNQMNCSWHQSIPFETHFESVMLVQWHL